MNARMPTVTASLLGLLLALPAASRADDGWEWGNWGKPSYSLRFTPASLSLQAGEVGHFRIEYLRKGDLRFSRPRDYRVGVSPELAASLAIEGERFRFVAQRPGLYRVDAAHDSPRASDGAKGTMWIRVSAPVPEPQPEPQPQPHPYPVLSDIRVHRADNWETIGGGVLVVAPGQQLQLQAMGLDQWGRAAHGFRAAWRLSSQHAGQLVVGGWNRATLVAGHHPCHGEITVWGEGTRVARVIRFTVGGGGEVQIPERIASISLHVRTHPGNPWQVVTGNEKFTVSPSTRIELRAIGYATGGEPLPFAARWSTGHGVRLLRQDAQSIQALVSDHPGSAFLVRVTDARTGVTVAATFVVSGGGEHGHGGGHDHKH